MKADIVIKSNAVFDSVSEKPFRGFVAVKGNKIVGVGDRKDANDYIDAETKVLDYGDKMVMAGFHDSHTHLLMAGMFRTYVNLINARSEEEAVAMVKKAADESPDKDGWSSASAGITCSGITARCRRKSLWISTFPTGRCFS